MRGFQEARRSIAAAAIAAILVSCAPTQPSPPFEPDPTKTTTPTLAPSTQEPSRATVATTPTPPPTPTVPAVALVPVVGFWSATTGLSLAELDAALAGRSTRYSRVLVAGMLPGAIPSTPDVIRAAVNADARTLGLLPAGEVTPDVQWFLVR